MSSNTTKPVERKGRKVIINDSDEVIVDAASSENYFSEITIIHDSVIKCSGCSMVTIHEGYEIALYPVSNTDEVKSKRLYVCTNCAKPSLK